MLRIAIVDDDSTIVEGIRHFLLKKIPNITIPYCYTDGTDAFNQLANSSFDLLITDISMGQLSGLDLIEQLQEKGSARDFSSIVISAHQDFQYAKKGIDLSIKSYLTKPINFPYLVELVLEERDRRFQEEPSYNEHLSEPVQHVVDYIKKHYQDNITLKNVANSLHYNPAYLGRAFKKEMDTSFNDYLLSIRMNQAQKLLKQTLFSIDEISLKVGIEHVSYFSTIFKKNTGKSPSKYRKFYCDL